MPSDAILEQTRRTAPAATREHTIRGGGGTRLHAREWGDPDGPEILFVHGWSQTDLCWSSQVGSPLAQRFRLVTFDNRGHGRSEKPDDTQAYTDERLWADDLAAVIEQTGLERPVLVAWSYGGYVVGDYLRAHGAAGVAGIDLVGAAVLLRPPAFDHIGPGLLENAEAACGADIATSIPAIRRFLRACTAEPLDDDVWDAALCWNMLTPPEVRGALLAREIDMADVLARVSVPVLVTHGRQDAIVLPSMAEYALAICPTAVPSWYDGSGHMPFVEAAQRFNRELSGFVDEVSRARSV
jgi:non-heme chloroperoxidase